jgi:hypothetical protein
VFRTIKGKQNIFNHVSLLDPARPDREIPPRKTPLRDMLFLINAGYHNNLRLFCKPKKNINIYKTATLVDNHLAFISICDGLNETKTTVTYAAIDWYRPAVEH